MAAISPNEMVKAAKDMMLEGREPELSEDYARMMNFIAANVASGLELATCKLMGKLYDMPLSEYEIEQIVNFQVVQKLVAEGEE